MKTQNFGRAVFVSRPHSIPVYEWNPRLIMGALKNYRENRENGSDEDNPFSPFPSCGLELVDNSGYFYYNFKLEPDFNKGQYKSEVINKADKKNGYRYWSGV